MQLTDIRSCLISVQNELLLSGFNITPFCIKCQAQFNSERKIEIRLNGKGSTV